MSCGARRARGSSRTRGREGPKVTSERKVRGGVQTHQHGAAAHVLHDQPELAAVDIRPKVARHVRRVALRHHRDLLLDVLDLVLRLLEVDDLDRDRLARLALDAAEALAERALPDALHQLVHAVLGHRGYAHQGRLATEERAARGRLR